MAFIRAKKRKTAAGESTFYYVVQSYREEGRVRHQTLAYLGSCSTIEAAIYVQVRHVRYQQRYWELARDFIQAEADQLSKQFTPEQLALIRARRRKWKEVSRLDTLLAILTKYPQRIETEEHNLARLREAAAVLGVADEEALVLPGTQRHADAFERVEASLARNSRVMRWLALGLKREKEAA